MSSSGKSPVSYLCPKCQTKLTASREDAGQRRECPHCGKIVKVPGTAASSGRTPADTAPSGAPLSRTGGIANIPVVCPLCGTRMYATKNQIGQTMVCPDCLESVVVPDRSPPKPPPPRPTVAPPPPPGSGTAGGSPPASEAEDDPDDYKLSDAVELPHHRTIGGVPAELIDRYVLEPEAVQPEPPPGAAPVPPAAEPDTFAIKCPVCDTMIQAAAEDIGTKVECPDCFSMVVVQRPHPKPRRVNKVVESDYKDNDYILGAATELDVFRPTKEGTAPRSVGEEALQKAREAQAQREREQADLPTAPLFTGLFDYLPDAPLVARMVMTGVLFGLSVKLLALLSIWLSSDDPSYKLLALAGSVGLLILAIPTLSFAAINFLTVLQESAEGCSRVEDWPENSLADWITESLSVAIALFFAVTPGALLVLTAEITRIPLSVCWFFVGLSLYVLFPIVQLSILESASLVAPVSRAIVDSIRNEFLLWATFYIMTFFLFLAVVIVTGIVRLDYPLAAFLVMGVVMSFAGFLYFRLLGRLAWACQMRPLQKKGKETGTQDSQPPDADGAAQDR